MVLKRSVFEIQKQRTKNCNDPSYGYGAIHETLQNCAIARNGAILEHFHELLRNHNSDL